MFGANLKHLCRDAPSISALCRDLGINRTQFNPDLGGEGLGQRGEQGAGSVARFYIYTTP